MINKNNDIGRKMTQSLSKMNLGRLAVPVIFVLLFGIASHSLNFAFANENTSHEKVKTSGFGEPYKTNVTVTKDKSIEDKVKEAKEKLQAEIKHLKELTTRR